MKKCRQLLALLLVIAMVSGLGINTYATESTTGNTAAAQSTDATEENGSSQQSGGAAATSVNTGTKPADGTASGNPFPTSVSSNYRIPAMVTLSDGTIVAAADARWDSTQDGGGNDTIVSYSTDKGAIWNYTFANYLGDNGNVHDNDSTAFIDPALATDGSTVYMMVDLFPAGCTINNAETGTGFDAQGRLLLSTDGTTSSSTYNYYLADGKIYSSNGTEVSGLTVDGYFNVKGTYNNQTIDSNLFFADSPFKVLKTNYLYLTKSTDGGKTWSAPTLLNLKKTGESFYGVGPGRGLVTSDGKIIFSCYTNNAGKDGKSSVIYSSDGVTWERSADVSDQTSEASVVEANGNLYMFTRHGGYYVSVDNGATWGSKNAVSGINYNTNCQLNAITYSEKVNGKTAILLSVPGSANDRAKGEIFTLLVGDNGDLSVQNTYDVNGSSYYAYSCLTELNDGSVGLLYESDSAAISYTKLAIATVTNNATIGEVSNDGSTDNDSTVGGGSTTNNVTETKDITVTVGETTTVTDETGNHGTRTVLDDSTAKVETVGTDATTGKEVQYTEKSGVIASKLSYGKFNGYNQTSPATSDYQENSDYYVKVGDAYYTLWVSRMSYYYYYYYYYGYKTSSTSDVTLLNSGGQRVNYSGNNSATVSGVTVYTKTETDVDTPASTVITFTGKEVGTTSVVIGTTQYTITVKEKPAYVSKTDTPFVSNTGQGDGEKITKLTTSVGVTYDINFAEGFSGGTWSIADNTIATVDSTGKVTGKAVGETTLTWTSTDGKTSYTMPIVIRAGASSSSVKYFDFYIDEILNTTVYCSWNCSTDLIQCQEGEAIYVAYNMTDNACCDFFGKPDEGYALTYMAAPGSAGNYCSLHTGDHKTINTDTNTNFQNHGAGQHQGSDKFGSTDGEPNMVLMVKAAIEAGCDGGMGFTRESNDGDCSFALTFRSRRLPTVEKTIKCVKVNGQETPYTENMIVSKDDVIVYTVTVTQYVTGSENEAITYTTGNSSGATLTDNLNGATFTKNGSQTQNVNLSNGNVTKETTYTYEVQYTIKDDDIDTKDGIVNTVDLSYKYKAAYSTGTYPGKAQADAKFKPVSFAPKDIVVDFGLPVTVDYSGKTAHGRYNLESGTSALGVADVSVSGNKVTYTLKKALTGVDTVTLTNENGATYDFKVYPATSVYYEENFGTYTTGEVEGSSQNLTQTDSAPGAIVASSGEAYGYDASYADVSTVGDSNGTSMKLGTSGKGEFTFTGTGVDIYTRSTTETGKMMVYLYQGDTLEKLYTVNTVMADGTTQDITTGQNVTAYNVPSVCISGLTRGEYTVKLEVVKTKVTNAAGTTSKVVNPVYIDGYRVYETCDTAYTPGTTDETATGAIYNKDKEDNPTLVQARDLVLATANVSGYSGQYNQNNSNNQIISQVYKALTETEAGEAVTGAILTSSGETAAQDNAKLKDLIDNGPKNEIYLRNGQSLVLNVNTTRELQVGLKALNAATMYSINGATGTVLNASTDMFYKVSQGEAGSSATGITGTVTIKNTGTGILSVTLLKICDASADAIQPITEDTIATALQYIGVIEPEVQTADATANIRLVDYAGNEIAFTALTANGKTGAEATFTADAIRAAADSVLPEGYGYADANAITDQTVVYGESGDVTVQVGKLATLTVTYKRLFGKTVGTATLTAVQTSSASQYTFSAAQIRNAVPDGYWTIKLAGKKVKFGATGTLTVQVF